MRILVIEDEDRLRRVVQLHLTAAGYEVDEVIASSVEMSAPAEKISTSPQGSGRVRFCA